MPDAKMNGINIQYEDSGSGPAVFLTHGYAATGRMWKPQREPLTDAGYRLITWDMRGHGGTDSPDDQAQYSEALTMADMAGLLDHLGVERAVVGGLSLGGYMSLGFYLAHPERVQALVLCDTGPGYRNPEARDGWNRAAEKRAVDFETRGLDALSRSAEVRATGSGHRSAQGLAHTARGMLAQSDARVIDVLPSIGVPALIIIGEKDEPFMAGSQYMANKIPNARLEVIAGAGHASNIDQPEAFNRVLLEFLKGLPD